MVKRECPSLIGVGVCQCGHCKDKFHNRHDGDRHKYNMSDDVNDWLDNDQWGDMELGIHE